MRHIAVLVLAGALAGCATGTVPVDARVPVGRYSTPDEQAPVTSRAEIVPVEVTPEPAPAPVTIAPVETPAAITTVPIAPEPERQPAEPPEVAPFVVPSPDMSYLACPLPDEPNGAGGWGVEP